MKEDEKQFLIDVYQHPEISPRDLINMPGAINYKRAWYLLKKWCGKDWYEYGVTLDLGWLTDKGKKMAEELIKERVSGMKKLYVCDPEKNTECPKTHCQKECFHTTNPAYAKESSVEEKLEEDKQKD